MKKTERLNVKYHDRKVGTMALYKGRLAAFEYDRDWLVDGFSISPNTYESGWGRLDY